VSPVNQPVLVLTHLTDFNTLASVDAMRLAVSAAAKTRLRYKRQRVTAAARDSADRVTRSLCFAISSPFAACSLAKFLPRVAHVVIYLVLSRAILAPQRSRCFAAAGGLVGSESTTILWRVYHTPSTRSLASPAVMCTAPICSCAS
jgi:hypothetical protein